MSDKATLLRLLREYDDAKPDDKKIIRGRIIALFDAVRDEEYEYANRTISQFKETTTAKAGVRGGAGDKVGP